MLGVSLIIGLLSGGCPSTVHGPSVGGALLAPSTRVVAVDVYSIQGMLRSWLGANVCNESLESCDFLVPAVANNDSNGAVVFVSGVLSVEAPSFGVRLE